jgi:hypothetical protein
MLVERNNKEIPLDSPGRIIKPEPDKYLLQASSAIGRRNCH